jgi:hypothetical protein
VQARREAYPLRSLTEEQPSLRRKGESSTSLFLRLGPPRRRTCFSTLHWHPTFIAQVRAHPVHTFVHRSKLGKPCKHWFVTGITGPDPSRPLRVGMPSFLLPLRRSRTNLINMELRAVADFVRNQASRRAHIRSDLQRQSWDRHLPWVTVAGPSFSPWSSPPHLSARVPPVVRPPPLPRVATPCHGSCHGCDLDKTPINIGLPRCHGSNPVIVHAHR